MYANYQLTNETSSFVIYYSNKALSKQRPFHKAVENPCDQNKESSFNSQTFFHMRSNERVTRVTSVHRLLIGKAF